MISPVFILWNPDIYLLLTSGVCQHVLIYVFQLFIIQYGVSLALGMISNIELEYSNRKKWVQSTILLTYLRHSRHRHNLHPYHHQEDQEVFGI